MRKIVSFTHATLDGYIDDPHEWAFSYSDEELQDHLLTKYVVASRPVDPTSWDPTVVIAGPDLLDEVSRLEHAEGGHLLIWGTGQLTDALAAAGLLDEYRICTCPVIKGGGEPLFRAASTGTVELLDTRIFATGAVVHSYRPASPP